ATPKKGAQNSRWRCPRCDRKMHHAEAPGRAVPVTIDRCPKGDGLWFDEHELAEVLGSELAEDHPGLQSVKDFLGSFAEAPQQEKES
ncbi:MAG: zf-TFIIB domain-containing protein, partial [Candidatus Methylomirabilales bacterium]